jgi:hypothetical protein
MAQRDPSTDPRFALLVEAWRELTGEERDWVHGNHHDDWGQAKHRNARVDTNAARHPNSKRRGNTKT